MEIVHLRVVEWKNLQSLRLNKPPMIGMTSQLLAALLVQLLDNHHRLFSEMLQCHVHERLQLKYKTHVILIIYVLTIEVIQKTRVLKHEFVIGQA